MEEAPHPESWQSEPAKAPWKAIVTAIGVLALMLGVVVFFASRRSRERASAPSPYASQLKISDLKLSAAENFVGGTATYLEGKITNNGDKPVIGASVQIIFRNSLGEVVGREAQPLMALVPRGPYVDAVPLGSNPLRPHETLDCRLTFERISADWNRKLPEVKITTVTTQ